MRLQNGVEGEKLIRCGVVGDEVEHPVESKIDEARPNDGLAVVALHDRPDIVRERPAQDLFEVAAGWAGVGCNAGIEISDEVAVEPGRLGGRGSAGEHGDGNAGNSRAATLPTFIVLSPLQ